MKKLLLTLSSVLFFLALNFGAPTPAFAAIAFDNASTLQTANSTSITYSYTVNSNTHGGLFVTFSTSGLDDQTGCTYATVAMTKLYGTNFLDNSAERWNEYFLATPATGANNVVCSRTSSNNMRSSAVSYTGVSQTAPTGTQIVTYNNIASGNDGPTINIAVANSWMIVAGLDQTVCNPTATFNDTKRSGAFGSNPDILDSNAALSTGNNQAGMFYGCTDHHAFLGIAVAPFSAAVNTFNFMDWFGF